MAFTDKDGNPLDSGKLSPTDFYSLVFDTEQLSLADFLNSENPSPITEPLQRPLSTNISISSAPLASLKHQSGTQQSDISLTSERSQSLKKIQKNIFVHSRSSCSPEALSQ